jgi:hypothetical protein
MKQMLSLSQLAATLQDQAATKADYVAPVGTVQMNDDATITVAGSITSATSTNLGHKQLGEFTGIPAAYYDRLRSNDQALLASNVNRWLKDKASERRMVRTLNGQVRALLSDRYQRVDNLEVAEVALNVLSDIPGLQIVSSAVTESRLYIKAVSSNLQLPVPGSRRVGDLVETGVLIQNSEVGLGAVSIKPFAHFLVCTNGMVRDKGGLRAAHVGRRIDMDLEGLLSDKTRRMEDEVVLRKVRDVISHAFNEAAFRKFLDELGNTTKQVIEGDVNAAVEALGPTLGLQVGERQSVLRHLIQGGDLSRYGLANAVTRTAEDIESYDRATEIETLGYRLIELPQRDWNAVSNAKALVLAA